MLRYPEVGQNLLLQFSIESYVQSISLALNYLKQTGIRL